MSDENPSGVSPSQNSQQDAPEGLLGASLEKPKRGRPPSFQPAEADIPAVLLPVALPLLGFWKAKAGKKTQQAWDRLLVELEKIWNDPAGGTDVLRKQLEMGIEAKTFGKGWQSITYSNWERFGKEWHKPQQRTLTLNQQRTLEAMAMIRAREAQKQQPQTHAITGGLYS